MKAFIYLKEERTENLLAKVNNLEVCPRGIYVINTKYYELKGQPKFYFLREDTEGFSNLDCVVLVVEEYSNAPKVRVTEC
jgi:hypothetical protein